MKIYTGIHGDFSRANYASIEKAKKAGCIYLMDWMDAQNGGPILDTDGNTLPYIQVGNWKAHNPIENRRTSPVYKSQLQIEDPFGEVKFFNFDNPLKLQNIIKTLEVMCSFHSWNEYDQSLMIKKLESEIEMLKKERK